MILSDIMYWQFIYIGEWIYRDEFCLRAVTSCCAECPHNFCNNNKMFFVDDWSETRSGVALPWYVILFLHTWYTLWRRVFAVEDRKNFFYTIFVTKKYPSWKSHSRPCLIYGFPNQCANGNAVIIVKNTTMNRGRVLPNDCMTRFLPKSFSVTMMTPFHAKKAIFDPSCGL